MEMHLHFLKKERNMYKLIKLVVEFIKQARNIAKKLRNKIVVFDFDGTMTEFRYAENSLLPCRDDEVYEYSKNHNIYANARMLAMVQYVIGRLNPDNVFVLTRTETTLIEKKNNCIYQNFPSIKKENIYHVQLADQKMNVLKSLLNKFNTNIIFVEDSFKTILNAEEAMPATNDKPGIIGMHISSWIP